MEALKITLTTRWHLTALQKSHAKRAITFLYPQRAQGKVGAKVNRMTFEIDFNTGKGISKQNRSDDWGRKKEDLTYFDFTIGA